MTIGQIYLKSVVQRLDTHRLLGTTTLLRLNTEQLNWEPQGSPNSIAIIVQHMHGNMLSRWTDFLTSDGEKPGRERDKEFMAQAPTAEQVMAKWNEGWECMLQAITALTPDDLDKTVYIRSEPHSVVDAINRQLAHIPYHVGQIVYIGKMILGENWESLSIPKGGSAQFNQTKMGNK
jgi:hypothetical protein